MSACLERGLIAARSGDYFEAHEHWEDAWRQMTGPEKTFWQAMIQLVVAMVHLQRGNKHGFHSMCQKARLRCHRLKEGYHLANPLPVQRLAAVLDQMRQVSPPDPATLRPYLDHFLQQIALPRWLQLEARARTR